MSLKIPYPEIPVGGRLKFFYQNWQNITDDKWVLSVIKEGFKFNFIKKPPHSGIKVTSVSAAKQSILEQEVAELLKKNAIEIVPKQNQELGFYSTFFLVPKKSGQMRPVINLKPLNRYIKKEHFKMDTLTKVINMVQIGDYAISLDLQDAYLHIPIHESHKMYLRFCLKKGGPCYQFKCLCFGPKPAPRCFTKIVTVIAAHLRAQNIRLAVYLDDWFALNQRMNLLLIDRNAILNLLINLGFLVNREKSALIPTQRITYLGGVFQLDKGLVFPTEERLEKLKLAVYKLMRGQATALDFLHLLGILASCIQLIPFTRLHMRPIQIHMLQQWKPSSQIYSKKIPVTPQLTSHLKWWLQTQNISQGKSLVPWETDLSMTTDASLSGFGGHVQEKMFQGV